MRRTIFVLAVVASLSLLACAASGDDNTIKTENSTFVDLKDTIMGFVGPFLKSEVLPNFKFSSVFGLFDSAVGDINFFGRSIDDLREKCLKEQKEIESIRAWAQAAASNATQSDELTHKLNSLTTKEETGKKQLQEIEKQKAVIEDKKKEAEAAVKDFDNKEAILMQAVVDALTDKGLPSADGLIKRVEAAAPVLAGMYLSYKKANAASTAAEEAFQAARQTTKSIKQHIQESQEIEKSLQASELKHANPRKIVDPDGAIISDVSSGFSLLQNGVFLTLVAAFLIADKPVW